MVYDVWGSKAYLHYLHEMECLSTGLQKGDPSERWANNFYDVKFQHTN